MSKASPSRSHGRKSVRLTAQPRDLMGEEARLAKAWQAQVITLMPQAFPGVLGESLTGKALKDGIWQLEVTDLRRFGEGKHRNVDDTPAGGGAGMVLRADIVARAIEEAQRSAPAGAPLIYLSPRGVPFRQAMARGLAEGPGVTLLSGRFEGVDERVLEEFGIMEVSLGDFVMTGGEIAAQAMIDACVRLLPGVLGNAESAVEESHASGLLEHPHYTRPAEWRGRKIPEVLTSGDHGKVAAWRRDWAERITRARRPDLWAARLDLPDVVAGVTDQESFARFCRAELDVPLHRSLKAESILEAMVGCLEDPTAPGRRVDLPGNPWQAAAYLLWLGTVKT